MTMTKKYKWTLILSSIVTLLPMVLALFVGGIIPEEIAIHFGFNGVADGFGDATIMFVILPLSLLALHWLCVLLAFKLDRKNFEENGKITRLVLWLIPAISLVTHGSMLAIAMGVTKNIHVFFLALMGIMFIVIGNYMPKMRKSITSGIKVHWAYTSDENWFYTHRFAGRIYMIMGFIMLIGMFLPVEWFIGFMIAAILVGGIIPVVYSYKFYKKQLADGTLTPEQAQKNVDDFMGESIGSQKKAKKILLIVVAIVVAILLFVLFAGEIEITAGDNAILVEAPFYGNIEINYADIDSVEYREDSVGAMKVNGFDSAKLLLGTFQNSEFGYYKRYTSAKSLPCIVINVDGKFTVIGTSDAAQTQKLYEDILVKIAE